MPLSAETKVSKLRAARMKAEALAEQKGGGGGGSGATGGGYSRPTPVKKQAPVEDDYVPWEADDDNNDTGRVPDEKYKPAPVAKPRLSPVTDHDDDAQEQYEEEGRERPDYGGLSPPPRDDDSPSPQRSVRDGGDGDNDNDDNYSRSPSPAPVNFGGDVPAILTSESLPSAGTAAETIRVCVRVRPLIRDEKDKDEVGAWGWDTQSLRQERFPPSRQMMARRASLKEITPEPESRAYDPLLDTVSASTYVFDHLFNPEHTNDDIYRDVVHNIVVKAMQGYHGSVFTYGQTSSGKTFTMTGTAKSPGIIPQAVFDAFEQIEQHPDREFLLRVCYLEVYKEQVKDLLNPDPIQSNAIKVLYDPKTKKITMNGLKEQVVNSPQQVMQCLQTGEAQRHVGATNMNEQSSRAHTVFRMVIESKDPRAGPKAPVRQSTLNLIDLAGSENSKMTGSRGERQTEGKFINQSLLALSTIIQRLSEAKSQHLPFRDSKLTRILQEPLSGNAVIAIICTITPALRCADETHNTLKFATRAKKVKLDAAVVNELTDERGALLLVYQQEIEQLKRKLAEMASRPPEVVQVVVERGQEVGDGGSEDGSGYDEEEDEVEEEEQDNEEALLRMIDEMDRYIMKADAEKHALGGIRRLGTSRDRGSRDMADGGDMAVLASSAGVRLSRDQYGETDVIPPHDSEATLEHFRRKSTYDDTTHMDKALLGVAKMLQDLRQQVAEKRNRSASIRKIDRMELHHATDSEFDDQDHAAGGGGGGKFSRKNSIRSRKNSIRPATERDRTIEVETLKLDIRLKDADSRYLQDLLHKKDEMLQQLTRGLAELEKSQQQWADDLYNAKVTIDELFDENQDLKKENETLREKLKVVARSGSF